MLAVYYYDFSSPFGMYALEVEGDSEDDFYKVLLANEDYPHPTSDVMIIDGNKVVNQFHSKYQST